MVHGDCSSRGCYAMTDEQIGEIYALGRESFFGGQKSFQVQAYPFRMTPLNMAKHRNNPNMAFWRMLKEGNDHFEVTRPGAEGRRLREALRVQRGGAGRRRTPLNFSPRGQVPGLRGAAGDRRRGEREAATRTSASSPRWCSRGTPTVAVRTGNDGGMHPMFVAKLKRAGAVRQRRPRARRRDEPDAGPARHGHQPAEERRGRRRRRPGPVADAASRRVASPTRASRRRASRRTGRSIASVRPCRACSDCADRAPTPRRRRRRSRQNVNAGAVEADAAQADACVRVVPTGTARRQAGAANRRRREAGHDTVERNRARTGDAAPAQASGTGLMAGAQPVMQSGSFESRWGGMR